MVSSSSSTCAVSASTRSRQWSSQSATIGVQHMECLWLRQCGSLIHAMGLERNSSWCSTARYTRNHTASTLCSSRRHCQGARGPACVFRAQRGRLHLLQFGRSAVCRYVMFYSMSGVQKLLKQTLWLHSAVYCRLLVDTLAQRRKAATRPSQVSCTPESFQHAPV